MGEKGRSTQSIVNAFPLWSKVRTDEQSLGYQVLNPVGKALDKVRKQLQDAQDNYFLGTARVDDIDVYYKVKLADSYTFTKTDEDTTDFIYTPPTVSGIISASGYQVSIASENDIETFWYTPAPDRIELGAVASGQHLIATGYVDESPFSQTTQSGLHITNHITVGLDMGTSFVGVNNKGQVRRCIVQLEGKNRTGAAVEEEMAFIHNETKHSLHEYSEVSVSGLRVYGVEDPSTTTISFMSGAFALEDYPVFYNLDNTAYREEMPVFWALSSGTNTSVKTLDLKKYDTDDLELRMQGYTTKHSILQQELQDTAGSGIIPRDLAVQPRSDKLWVVDDTKLYVYNNALPYPDMSALSGKEYDAACVIEPESYYAVIGDEVQIDYIWARPTVGILAHRVWVEYPDGNTYSLENGVAVSYHTDGTSWVYGEPARRKLRDSEFYTLSQRGDYIFSLEVKYTDDTTSLDRRIVSVVYKQPEAEFTMSALGILNNLEGVDFDSEYNLWVADTSGVKYRIDRHYDRMLVDFDRKILYFREPYDRVIVY